MALSEILQNEIALRSVFGRSAAETDTVKAEAALSRLYESLGHIAPAVVWCRGLYQFVCLPSLLIGLIHGDMWQVLSCTLATSPFSGHRWQSLFDEAWSELWENGGAQLLQGMKRTSRLAQQCPDLESSLIEQAKNALAAWLRSGKLPDFENTLNRQLYRRFWAMHLWHKDFVRERILVLSNELDYELSRAGQFRQAEWEQFAHYAEQLRTLYGGVAASVSALVTRMGAEPAAQVRNSLWLPFAFPNPTLCAIWQKHVNPASLLSHTEEISLFNSLGESIFGAICLEHVTFVCEQPTTLTFDAGGRLHNETGPALCFSDGFAAHVFHGVAVERRIVEHPGTITLSEIDQASNIELRRVLLERYGQARYLQDSGAEVIHQDDFGILYRKPMGSDEPLVMVKVVNSTREPDGSYKDYFLRVPPHMKTAREAVAWTFGFEEEDYSPAAES